MYTRIRIGVRTRGGKKKKKGQKRDVEVVVYVNDGVNKAKGQKKKKKKKKSSETLCVHKWHYIRVLWVFLTVQSITMYPYTWTYSSVMHAPVCVRVSIEWFFTKSVVPPGRTKGFVIVHSYRGSFFFSYERSRDSLTLHTKHREPKTAPGNGTFSHTYARILSFTRNARPRARQVRACVRGGGLNTMCVPEEDPRTSLERFTTP